MSVDRRESAAGQSPEKKPKRECLLLDISIHSESPSFRDPRPLTQACRKFGGVDV